MSTRAKEQEVLIFFPSLSPRSKRDPGFFSFSRRLERVRAHQRRRISSERNGSFVHKERRERIKIVGVKRRRQRADDRIGKRESAPLTFRELLSLLMRPSRSFQRGGARNLCLEERERERERERSLGKRSGARVCVFSRESREEKSGRECEKFFHFFSFALERRRQEFFSSSAFLSLSVSRERETEPLDSSTQAHREPFASLSDHFRRCRAGR